MKQCCNLEFMGFWTVAQHLLINIFQRDATLIYILAMCFCFYINITLSVFKFQVYQPTQYSQFFKNLQRFRKPHLNFRIHLPLMCQHIVLITCRILPLYNSLIVFHSVFKREGNVVRVLTRCVLDALPYAHALYI